MAAQVPTRWRWLDWPARARRTAAAAYLGLVTWALLAPASSFDAVDIAFAHGDKLAHGLIFLALALMVRWALPGECGRGRGRTAVLAALVCHAVSMEILQAVITASQRTFEWQDMAFNLAGLWAGWTLFGPMVTGVRGASSRDSHRAGIGRTIRRRAVR
jgi:VanZ family protein